MKKIIAFCFLLISFTLINSCKSKANTSKNDSKEEAIPKIIVGAENFEAYLPDLKGKKVGLVINHTSEVFGQSLVDFLLEKGVDVKAIFAPEHGFRGEASAGDHIDNSIDAKTKLPIISIYGKNKKPSKEQLENIDILIYDIQDVGARFYTYISTLYYVMQATAESNKELIILDRPNPLGKFVDGPMLDMEFKSFVGITKLPVLHGMTVGELGRYYNGEKLLGDNLNCNFKVVKVENYTHNSEYVLPIRPSPNLPNMQSIYLYPSLCWFEPTKISVGRGTDKQFQVIGGPDQNLGEFSFTPVDKPGAVNPVNEGVLCYGLDLSSIDIKNQGLTFKYLIEFYRNYEKKETFFTNTKFFNLLAGNDWLIKAIKEGKSDEEIKEIYQPELEIFKKTRNKYLLYL